MSSDDESTDGSRSCDSENQIPWPHGSFERIYCFSYGALMDLEILAKVLGMSNCPPILRPAKVMRYDIKLWGPLPALVDKRKKTINGVACEIMTQTQLDRLVLYETHKYDLRPCSIYILNDQTSVETRINGVTFMWNGDKSELKEERFDLKQREKDTQLRELDMYIIRLRYNNRWMLL